jgi:hypothetical protein
MMGLVTTEDVEVALLRPLSDAELEYTVGLCDAATTLLRSRMPDIDARIASYAVSPTAARAVDPALVALVLADVVRRYLVNPKGLWSTTETTGPYSVSETFPGARGGTAAADVSGLAVTAADIAKINGVGRSSIRSLQLSPTQSMQPRSTWLPGEVQVDPVTGEPLDGYWNNG